MSHLRQTVREPTAVMNEHKPARQKIPVMTNYAFFIVFALCQRYPIGLPFSGQTDVRLLGAAFAQGEQFPDDLLGFTQDQGSAGLQLGVALLEGQVSRPELGNHGHIQEPVSGQALQEGFEFICREYNRDREGGDRGGERENRTKLGVCQSNLYINNTFFELDGPIHHSLFHP